MLKSDSHTVVEEVNTDCVYRLYDIESTYGNFHVESDYMLKVRLHELHAIAELKEISAAEAIASGVVDSIIEPFEAAIHVALNPIETVAGLPGGILSFFKRVFYAGEKIVEVAVGVISDDHEGDEVEVKEQVVVENGEVHETENEVVIKDKDQGVNYLIDWYLGVRSGERNLAKDLRVDPYTSNVVLAEELKRVGSYERVGKVGISIFAAPVIPVLGVIKDINRNVWEKDPRELREFNKNNLREMGISEEVIEAFFNSPYYSPTFQTTIVLGLRELEGVENLEKLLKDSLVANSIADARYITATVVLMVWYHNNIYKFERIPEKAYIPSAITLENKIVTMIPSDYICWSREVAEAAIFHDHVLEELEVDNREYWFASKISDRTRDELTNLGWEVVVDETLKKIGTPGTEETMEEAAEEINEESMPLQIDVHPDSLFDKPSTEEETEPPK